MSAISLGHLAVAEVGDDGLVDPKAALSAVDASELVVNVP